MKNWSKILSVTVLLLLVSTQLPALTVKKMSIDQMTHKAEVIVIGKVLSAYSDFDGSEHNHLYTYITVRVDEYLKGKQRPRTLVLKTLGGTKGNMVMQLDGAADFFKDEEVMLFLARRNDGSLFPISAFQGKLAVYREEGTGRKVVVTDYTGRGRYFHESRKSTIERSELSDRVFLDDVRGRVKSKAQE